MTARLDLTRHPCFNAEVKGECGRIHLPVAPRCNIKCNYCNRKYDCVNESRPGVAGGVLSPAQAVAYLEEVLEREPRISVVGIAGPGDPFANAPETLDTLRRVREKFPHLLICLATNGLGLPPHLDELAAIGVSHVTITVNAVDPAIGEKIFAWVRDGKVIYRGVKAAELLLQRQLESICGLKARGIVVKVNFIVIPGINDHHAEEVARKMKELGVDLLNCMPMYPNADTVFEHIPEPDREMLDGVRATAERHLPQMRHCTRCRADAVGLLGEDRSAEFSGCLRKCSKLLPAAKNRPYVAVATLEGILVNQHLGEATHLQIWGENGDGYQLVEVRATPKAGTGMRRWQQLAELVADCRALLVSGIGDNPRQALEAAGVLPVEMSGFIESGLEVIYHGGSPEALKQRRRGGCAKGAGCQGDGGGCG